MPFFYIDHLTFHHTWQLGNISFYKRQQWTKFFVSLSYLIVTISTISTISSLQYLLSTKNTRLQCSHRSTSERNFPNVIAWMSQEEMTTRMWFKIISEHLGPWSWAVQRVQHARNPLDKLKKTTAMHTCKQTKGAFYSEGPKHKECQKVRNVTKCKRLKLTFLSKKKYHTSSLPIGQFISQV